MSRKAMMGKDGPVPESDVKSIDHEFLEDFFKKQGMQPGMADLFVLGPQNSLGRLGGYPPMIAIGAL